MLVHQDAAIHASILDGDDRIEYPLADGRRSYVHVARGSLTVNGTPLKAGDALKVTLENLITLEQADNAEVLLFDLPY